MSEFSATGFYRIEVNINSGATGNFYFLDYDTSDFTIYNSLKLGDQVFFFGYSKSF